MSMASLSFRKEISAAQLERTAAQISPFELSFNRFPLFIP